MVRNADSLMPPRSLRLLAEAALSPLPRAQGAWTQWRESFDLDQTPWAEIRVLGAVARRIDLLEPDAEIAARIRGIRKFLWVNSQACVQASWPAISELVQRGIPVMLLKGAARLAGDRAAAGERLIRDVDILVPPAEAQRAFELLVEQGWAFSGWQIEARRDAPIAGHHAWSLTKDGGEVDLHHYSNHLNRLEGDDDVLWSRAGRIAVRGDSVYAPSVEDALLISLVHGVRFSEDGNIDWVIDAARLLDAHQIDWAAFLAEVHRRRLSAIAWTGAVLLNEIRDGSSVPDDVVNRLEATITAAQSAELPHYRQSAWPNSAAGEAAFADAALERALSSKATGSPGVQVPSSAVHSFTLQPGEHDLRFPVGKLMDDNGTWRLRILVTSGALMQSPVEVIYTAPGLPLGRGRALVDSTGRAGFELVLPAALLRRRAIEYLRVSVFVPAHAGTKPVQVDVQTSFESNALPL